MPRSSGDTPTQDDIELEAPPPSSRRRSSADTLSQELARGTRKSRPLILSRYILLGQLGSGGSSMVYKAYDPELDRKVALKLLQTRTDDARGRGRSRLLREAQAMAKLTHPNVVTVHDVSGYGEGDLGLNPNLHANRLEIPPRGIFIVMELVEGGDLRHWLNRRHRSWRSVLDVMLGAGKGLAAAHEVGIVHRDFKPGNLLIGDDGRVMVSDFGLARAAVPSASSSSRDSSNTSANWEETAHENLTRSGAVLGTPPYMSPEQHRGHGSDPRSDQFGFGVTLYEALFGVRPFSGSMKEMRQAKEAGQWRAFPSGTGVPARLAPVIERLLQPAPEDRYPSINELLEALERAGRSRVPRFALAGAVAAAVGGATAWSVLGSDEDPCQAGTTHVERVWSEAKQDAVRAAFESSAATYAGAAGLRVQAEIGMWTSRWHDAYRDACEATHERHEQSVETLDLRVACLGRHMRQLEAMVDLIEQGEAVVIENAVVSVQSLGNVDDCSDVAALTARIDLPASPEARARVDAGYGRLAEAHAQELAGRYEQAVSVAREVSDEATAVEYWPLHGFAQLRIASALSLMGDFSSAEEHLLTSVLSAERSRDEPTAADAWIDLVWVVGVEQLRPEEALRWIRFAEAAVDRMGTDPIRTAALDHNRAGVYYRLERYDEALRYYERAHEVQREHYGPQHPVVAQTLNHIGNVLIMQGRYERARVKCEQALHIRRQTLGADHPRVAAPLNNLAELLGRQDDHQGALDYAEQALGITRGSGRPEELFAWILVARQQRALGHAKPELDARRRALALLDAHPGFDQSSRSEHEKRIAILR